MTWEVSNHLGRDRHASVARWRAVHSGGKFAHTAFEVDAKVDGALAVTARPSTGRTHQIRVHLAEGGRPILGDSLYGGPAHIRGVPVPRTMLHAARLELPHPVTRTALCLEAPLPADFRQLAR